MKNLIKVINPDIANKLVGSGFSYIREQVNNQDVFVFISSPEILRVLQSNFDESDFVLENTLRF